MQSSKCKRRAHERGQAAVFVVLALGVFLIGSLGFVVDGANLWFHRQSAQTGADAACAAGAMDLLSTAAGVTPSDPDWIPASDDSSVFHCSGTTGSGRNKTPNSGFPPCSYATLNGYSGSGSQDVQVSFPPVSVATGCPNTGPFPTACAADNVVSTPYIRVDITDNVPTTFMRLLGAGPNSTVPARSTCGLSNVLSPVPILVLNPNAATGAALNTLTADNGFGLTILTDPLTNGNSGGLSALVQVNSLNSDVQLSSGAIDLSKANNGNGGGFAVAEREPQPPDPTINFGSSARRWVQAAGVVSDPFATMAAPPQPSPAPNPGPTCPGVPNGVACDDYQPGYYPNSVPCPGSASGVAAVCVQAGHGAGAATGLAVFEPGIYYLDGDFFAGNDSCLRPGDSTQRIGGTVFYFRGNHTLQVTPSSGLLQKTQPRRRGGTRVIFDCQTNTVQLSGLPCLSNLPSGITSIGGNVLFGACTGPYGDPADAAEQRGMLFFQDRDAQLPNSDQPMWSPAGSFGLIGNIYFHQCHLNLSGGSGANCDSGAFSNTFTVGNGSGEPGYIIGDIVVDQLHLSGNSNITVSLNPNPQYYVLKASLLQ